MAAPDIELIDTDDLIAELRRRSKVFFCVMRPIVKADYDWRLCWGPDEEPEALTRTLGLVELGKADLMRRAIEDGEDAGEGDDAD